MNSTETDTTWSRFAPEEPPPPSWFAETLGRLGLLLRHEWTLAILASLALGLFVNRGAWADPTHTLPEDVWDPSLVAYLISWGGHALLHQPGQLWQLNAFYPAPYGLAFTDSLLGYAPFGMIGTGLSAAILRYNIIFSLAEALTFLGAYALIRQVGTGRAGATVAALAVAVAPWRLGQAGHLHIISTGGILLALAMLARGHGFTLARRPGAGAPTPRIRPGWALAGWLVAAWQLTIGFGIGLVFSYVLLGLFVVSGVWWLVRRRRPGWRLLAADAGGGLIFGAVAVLMAQPYLKVLDLYPQAARSVREVAVYSPPLRGFFTAPPESVPWGDLHEGARALLRVPGEMDLLPGFVLYGLAGAGLFFSIWSVRTRLLLLAGVLASIALGMGTHGPAGGQAGYLWLLAHVPGFEGLRTPGRLIVWTTLLLALLAAGGVSEMTRQVRRATGSRERARPALPVWAVAVVPLLLVFVEGLGVTPHQVMPAAPTALSTVSAPYLVLPSQTMTDMHVMLWSTDRFAPVVNGGSGFVPTELARTRKEVATFPDQASVAYLRQLGVKTVVVVRDLAANAQWTAAINAPIDGLGIRRDVGPEVVLFHLDG